MPTRVIDLLNPQHVVLDLVARNEPDALRELVATFGQEATNDRTALLRDLIAREQLQSTNAGNGVAFPHARTDVVERIVLAIGRSREGVVFRDTEPPVHLLFLIGTPPAMVRDYLVCIGTLARLCRNRDMRERLLNAPTAERLIDELRAAIAVAAK